MLAKLRNFKTAITTDFYTGMQATLASSGVAQTISGITASSTTATVTTSAAHGYSTSNSVIITGAYPSNYNGTYTITVTSTTTFTYTMTTAPTITTATVSQYYPYPLGEVSIDGIFITIGSVNYPLQIINSTMNWNQLNAISIQASAIPQFYFPRRDDFGIWPTPQTAYAGTIYYHYRDRGLTIADYITGTVDLTYGSTKITGTGTTFTAAMVGRWFSVTSPTVSGQGLWFRVTSYTSATVIDVSQAWANATTTGATYRIGQTPEVPEEGQEVLLAGIMADYYTYIRKDTANSKFFSNLFYTGDPDNNSREEGNTKISGGLIGLINRYSDRDDTRIVKRKPRLNPLQYKAWATSLS